MLISCLLLGGWALEYFHEQVDDQHSIFVMSSRDYHWHRRNKKRIHIE
jgi:hypothetical protein